MPPKRKRDRSGGSGGGGAGVSTYTEPQTPGSLGGVERYARTQGLTQKEALEKCRGQLAYKLHRPIQQRFPTLPVVERFNRTLKGRMYRYVTAQGTQDYMSVLPALVEGYNKSRHGNIGMPRKT